MQICIDDEFVLAGFSDRFGGVSKGSFSELNLGYHVGDDAGAVMKNRQILLQKIGAKKLIFMEQIHSDNVEILTEINQELSPCDSVITSLRGVGICVMVADCSPVLLFDKKQKIISAIHAGRQGVVKKIVTKTVLKMRSKAENLSVFVGPNIKGSCYEVANMDLAEFNKFKIKNKFDMNLALMAEFEELKIDKVYFSKICTHCDGRFFSYRRDGVTGRFCGFIMLKG